MIMLLHLTRVDDVMCFKRISFLFLVQKKRLEVNLMKSEIYCLSLQILENQGNTVLGFSHVLGNL